MIIKKLLHGTDKFWYLYVSFAQYAFNNKIAALTGSTPFTLMFARSSNDFVDYTKEDLQLVDLDAWRQHQDKVLSLIWPAIVERVSTSKEGMIAKLDSIHRQLKEGSFPAGSEVMIVDQTRSTKFEPRLRRSVHCAPALSVRCLQAALHRR